MKKVFGWVVCGAFVMGMFSIAYAQFAKPDDAIAYRQSVMTLIGQHFGRIAAVVKGEKPYQQQEVAKNAELVSTLSKLPWDAFAAAGADKGKTHMKPEVLQNKEAFKSAAAAMEKEAAKLAQVAAGGSLDDVKTQFGAVGKSCKACHDKWRTQ